MLDHLVRLLPSLVSLVAVTLLGEPAVAQETSPGEPKAAAIRLDEQIEADWLRQDVVRTLPPAEPYRAPPAVTTQQDAAGAVDGVKDGTYGFHTERDAEPWWQVDLEQPIPLEKIVIFNRCDGNVEDRAGRLKILLSPDGKTWTELYEHDGGKFFGQTDGKPLSVPGGGASARFVRIALPAPEYFHLDEVEVYGVGSPENVALRKPADQSSTSPWSKLAAAASSEPASSEPPPEPTYPVARVVQSGLKLAEDLRQLGADVEAQTATLRQIAARLETLTGDAPASVRRESYLEARWAVRRMALSNPLLDFDDLLFVKRVPGTFTHMSDQNYGWFSRPGGGLFLLEDFKSDAPRLRPLTAELPPGSVLSPDISYVTFPKRRLRRPYSSRASSRSCSSNSGHIRFVKKSSA